MVVDLQHPDPGRRRRRGGVVARQQDPGAGVPQDEIATRRRGRRIERNVGGARPQRREDGDDDLHRSPPGDGDAVAGRDASLDERGGHGVGLLAQRCEAHLIRALPQRDALGNLRRGRFEHRDDGLARQGRPVGGVERRQRLPLVIGEDVDRGDRSIGIVEQGVEQPLEVAQAAAPQPFLENGVVEVEMEPVAVQAGEVVDLQAHRVHAVAVAGVHPLDLDRQAGEVAERHGHVVQHDAVDRCRGRRAHPRQRESEKPRRLVDTAAGKRPEGVARFDVDREREHFDEDAERLPRRGGRTTGNRRVERELARAARPVQPADEERCEQGETGEALGEAREAGIAAAILESTRAALVDLEREPGAGGPGGRSRPAVERD